MPKFGRGWLDKAKTDSDAQAKIDRVLKHPEFELYNVKEDPWELNNLAGIPEYTRKVAAMHAQLKAEMKQLNDSFNSVDYKQEKRERKRRGEAGKEKRKESRKKIARQEKQEKRKQK